MDLNLTTFGARRRPRGRHFAHRGAVRLPLRLAIAALSALFVLGMSPARSSAAAEGRYIDSSFFGMHAGYAPGYLRTTPWPKAPARLHSVGTQWCRLNPAPGVFNWGPLDAWLAQADAQGSDLIYTFSAVPLWASTGRSTATGGCGANTDVAMAAPPNEDAWRTFVTELVRHAAGRIKGYEVWNEPDGYYFTGTVDQMVRMTDVAAQVIRANDPNAKILSPGIARTDATWLQQYLARVPREDIDVVTFHGYAGLAPENTAGIVNNVRAAMAATGYSGYPLWNTEASWGRDAGQKAFSDPKWQRAYLARLEMLNISLGVERLYWYRYDTATPGQGWGSLWSEQTGLTPAGLAMGQVIDWLAGATLTAPCARSATGLWSCELTRPGGYAAQVVWSQSGTQNAVVPPQWSTMRTLDGGSKATTPVIAVGIEPVLLEPGAATPIAAPTTVPKATPTKLSSNSKGR